MDKTQEMVSEDEDGLNKHKKYVTYIYKMYSSQVRELQEIASLFKISNWILKVL